MININELPFKERMIFELEKDDYLQNCKRTSSDYIRRYNIDLNVARKLYRLVCNYQVEKYGYIKNKYENTQREFINNFRSKTKRRRNNSNINNVNYYNLKKIERRNE